MSNVYVRNNRIICFKRAASKLGIASEHFSPLPCQGNAEGSLSRLECISCALQILGFTCDHPLYLLQEAGFHPFSAQSSLASFPKGNGHASFANFFRISLNKEFVYIIQSKQMHIWKVCQGS